LECPDSPYLHKDECPGQGDDDDDDDDNCLPAGRSCSVNGDCCGFSTGDALCVRFPDQDVYCAAVCKYHSDCADNCCVPLEGGDGACGEASNCSGTSQGSGDACDECLDSCSGLSSCCTGSGCICEDECAVTGCTPPNELCCGPYDCICLPPGDCPY
jgi:hypothetical protein